MKHVFALAAGAATIALSTGAALADYPERPVTLLIGFAPGGATDTGARTLAPHLEKCLGGSVVVQNMPGASGEVAYAALARAEADGYMIGDIALPNVVTASITKEVPFAPDSYRYLGTLNSSNSTLSAPADKEWSTFEGVLEALRESPQGLSVGLASLGSEDQLTLIQIANAAGVTFNYIPFDGDAPAFNAMIGGHVDLVMSSSSATSQFADQVNPIAVAARERIPTLPDTPTLTELGYEIVAGSTHTVAAPAPMPDEIATKIADCITAISTDEAYLDEAATRSLPVNYMSAADTQAFVEDQHKLLKALWDAQPWFEN